MRKDVLVIIAVVTVLLCLASFWLGFLTGSRRSQSRLNDCMSLATECSQGLARFNATTHMAMDELNQCFRDLKAVEKAAVWHAEQKSK